MDNCKDVVNARSHLYNNEGNSLRPYYYLFERSDERGLFRLRLNYKYHKIRQKHYIRFTKQSRGFSNEYISQSNLMSLFKIAMFEFLGRYIVNVGSIVSINRKRIQSTTVDLGEQDDCGHVWYQGFMYSGYETVYDPLMSLPQSSEPTWISDCAPIVKIVHSLPESVNILSFCKFVRSVLFDEDDDAIIAMNYPIVRMVQITNEILRVYNLIRIKGNLNESLEYLNASITPTLYDLEFTIGLMRWRKSS
ncbi:Orf93 [Heliothis zea nudivirus]|uniref:Uncharacterized protein n=2 Tax=Betanudivirus hezeae TaxID=3052000 RepID=G9I075_HZNV2|nr:Orf93 [Heliothis zea nudivirus]YP_004956797.1 orf49 gene product [Helicoverpa zea nudivirus 2]AAN04387.1 Orf93 [Heliothis zea nudivirus]AEW69598.1 hypothetical protein Hz2V049 [Helicoverpa zea nudivirus 2]WCZ68529.1 hypothetical protein HvNV049 [Heliothis virescens nudivirus]